MHPDGTYVGRSAPEIDVFEATVSYADPAQGEVSQSGQWAPFNAEYVWFNTSANLIIPDSNLTQLNSYTGGVFQQSTSGLTTTNQECYETTGGCFSVYGFEYKPGFDNAWVLLNSRYWVPYWYYFYDRYIGWITDDKLAWQINSAGVAADSAVEIAARPIPQEPMVLFIFHSTCFSSLINAPYPSSISYWTSVSQKASVSSTSKISLSPRRCE